MILGGFHAAFPMEDGSRVGEARRHAAQLAEQCRFDAVDAGRLALVVTELATNLVRHARGGRLLVTARPARAEVEVLAIDQGPGIDDVDRCMHDGFSTRGTAGTGLGAVRRLSQQFDVHSGVPGGTVIAAVVRAGAGAALTASDAASSLCTGALALRAPGEAVCGDGWGFCLAGDRATLMVVDGLGHGPDAAHAAAAALEVFAQNPLEAPRALLLETHERLKATRGAAVMLLQADAGAGTVRYVGAGNVMARLVSGVEDRTLLCQHGTAGVTIRTPDEVCVPWPAHALLVVHTDGIESRWKPQLLVPVLRHDPALAAALLVRDHCRGRDDASVAVLRRKD